MIGTCPVLLYKRLMQSKPRHIPVCRDKCWQGISEDKVSFPGSFGCPGVVFHPYPDQLRDIQQVVQGIGAVPQLMLAPEALRHRQEQELVNVRAGQGEISGLPCSVPDPPSPKKPERLQATPSSSSFMQEGVSCSSSGYPHSPPVITG